MVRQFARRDSRGCVEESWGVLECEEWEGVEEGCRERFERRVSWTPGAEGAEGARVVWFAWFAAGTMRRDWIGG